MLFRSQSRQVDSERPLYRLDGSRDGDETATYDKGGWVFWMLLQRMGRENTLAGMREFLRRYHHQPDHPVLQDFVATMREFAPDAQAFDDFAGQWFGEVVVPEYELSDARSEAQDGAWQVTVTVANQGKGRMPVDVCAARGVRFPEEDDEVAWDGTAVQAAERSAEDGEPYREVRASVVLGPGESQQVTLEADFEPERVLVDPDCLVLQLRREQAGIELH